MDSATLAARMGVGKAGTPTGMGSESMRRASARRWDETRELREQDEDGIDLKMDTRQESWIDSLDKRRDGNGDDQSLLTRLDLCEETKNKQRVMLGAESGTSDRGVSDPAATTGDIPSKADDGSDYHAIVDKDEDEDAPDDVSSAGRGSVASLGDVTGGGSGSGEIPEGWDAASACGGQRNAESIGIPESDNGDLLGEKAGPIKHLFSKIPVFDPTGFFRSYWDWFVIILVLYVAVMVPMSACIISQMQKWVACMYVEGPDGSEQVITGTWQELYESKAFTQLAIFDSIVDCVFIVDVILNFNTGFFDKHGEKIYERRAIARNYIQGFFFIDLISSIPFDYFIQGDNVGAVSALKCIRLLRLGRLMKKLDQMQNANMFRVVKLMLFFTLITHWVSCLWFLIGNIGAEEPWNDSQPAEVSWIADIQSSYPECYPRQFSFSYWYMISFYWAITTLTTVGYGDITPLTSTEVWFTICVEWSGNVISAVIVGNVAVLLGTFEAAYQRYRERIETLNAFTEAHDIPGNLSKRMIMSIDFFFEKTQGLDFSGMLHKVSPAMRAEVLLVLYGSSVSSTNLFEDAPEAVVKAIVQKLECVEYFTDDFVVRAGDPGSHLYIVHTGKVKIVPKNEARAKKSRAVMATGALFGEMPVFSGKPHLTHVKCVEPCELLQLSKYDLEDLLVDFPDFMTLFKERVKSKMRYLRHMRTAGQAPPEMLELHGLEAPEFVKPNHGGEDGDDDEFVRGAGKQKSDPGIEHLMDSPAIGSETHRASDTNAGAMLMFDQIEETQNAGSRTLLSTLGGFVADQDDNADSAEQHVPLRSRRRNTATSNNGVKPPAARFSSFHRSSSEFR